MPSADVDIVAMLGGHIEPAAWSPEVIQMLLEFEPQYVAALERRSKIAFEVSEHVYKAQSIGYKGRELTPGSTEHQEMVRVYSKERLRYMKPKLDIAAKIVDLHHEFLQRVQPLLQREVMKRWLTKYQQAAYPGYYPDPMNAESWFDVALELPNLDDSQREAIEEQRRAFRTRHTLMTEQLCEVYDGFCMIRGLAELDRREDRSARFDELKELGKAREDLNHAQVTFLQTILEPHQREQLPPWPEEPPQPWIDRIG